VDKSTACPHRRGGTSRLRFTDQERSHPRNLVIGMPVTQRQADLAKGLRERLRALGNGGKADHPVRLSLDETENLIRTMWEFVGHFGADVGSAGYEFNFIERAHQQAELLQVAMLAAMAHVGPHLLLQEEASEGEGAD
jgi:hypothetical protein